MHIDVSPPVQGRIGIGRGWSLWPTAALRSAGFPFGLLESLAAPAGALAADAGEPRTAALRAATRRGVDAFAASDAFRRALTWQNPDAMGNWVAAYAASLAAGAPLVLDRMERREALIARYAQRYCAKNDTIGFFGPVAWAALGGGATAVVGGGTETRIAVGFEVWALQAVVRTWNAEPALADLLPVRLDPAVRIADGLLHRPLRAAVPVSAAAVALAARLAGCGAGEEPSVGDLRREGGGEEPSAGGLRRDVAGEASSAGDLRRDAAGDESSVGGLRRDSAGADSAAGGLRRDTAGDESSAGGLRRDTAAAALDELRGLDAVRVGFRVPIDGRPEHHVRAQVARIADPAVRERLLAALSEVEAARAAAAGADTAEALGEALSSAGRALAAAAGHEVRFGPGLTPGGRTPLYVDGRRDLDAVVGDAELDDLGTPLSVLLDSARWLAAEVGQAAHEEFVRRYRELRASRAVVTLADLQFASADVLRPDSELYTPVRTDFQLRWAEILPDGPDDAIVPAAAARELADVLFRAHGRLWAAARTHSPDVMLRRRADGSLGWVLGELHVALNTLESRVFSAQADDPAALGAAAAADSAKGRVVPVYPSTAPEVSSRTYPPLALDFAADYRYWSYGSDDGHPGGAASTPAADLLVTEEEGDLVATSHRDRWRAPVVECFGEFLTAVVVNMFRIRAPRASAPRVDLGGLTVCRRQWRFAAGRIRPLPARSRDAGQDALRAWARSHGIGRHAFVTTPAEPKPFYVDFDAPVLVDNLARAIRRLRDDDPVDVSEMLPAPDELWLADPADARYTSELRMVAVDPDEHPAASWDISEVADGGR